MLTNTQYLTAVPDFQRLFEATPGLYLVLDQNLLIVAVSNAYLRATHTERSAIIGRYIFDVFPDDPSNTVAASLHDLRASLERVLNDSIADTMNIIRYPIRRITANNTVIEERYWAPVNTPVFDLHGNVAYIINAVKDVTETMHLKQRTVEQQQISAALRTRTVQMEADISRQAQAVQAARADSEMQRQRLYSLLMQAPVAIAIFRGPQHVIELVNDRHLQLWGRTAENVLNKPLFEALPEARGQGLEELLAGVFKTGETYIAHEQAAQRIRNGQTETGYFNVVYQALREADGHISGVIVIANEITEQVLARKQVEEIEQRQMLALNAAQMGIWDLDLVQDHAVRTLRHDQIFGYDTLQPAWNQTIFFQHVLKDDQAYAQQCFAAALQTGALSMQCRIQWPDQSVHWIDAQGQISYAADGTPTRMLGVVMDITERKKLEARRDEFLSVASHEIKTPVTAIKGMAELLLQSASDRQTSGRELRALRTIVQQVDRMMRLVNDMLDVSRIDAGKFAVVLEPVELLALLTEVIEQQQLVYPEFTFMLHADGPCWISGNSDRLQQVLLNLLTNATQHSPSRSTVTVTLQQDATEAIVSVRDEGVGIPQAKLAHIFERYYQAQDRPVRGLGLGLYISKEIIEQHGGRIWVTSTTFGQGSTFSFALPIRK